MKRIYSILFCALLVFTLVFSNQPIKTYAAGVPAFDHTQFLNGGQWYSPRGATTSMFEYHPSELSSYPYWMEIWRYDGFSFGNNFYFHGNVSIGNTMTGNTGSDRLGIEASNDGVNWTPVWGQRTGNSASPFSISGTYRFLRGMGYASTVWSGYTNANNFYIGNINADLYVAGADQATAQSAADNAYWANQNAYGANVAAQGAQNAANNAATYATQAVNWLNGTWGGYSLGQVGTNTTNIYNTTYDGTNSVVNYAKAARDGINNANNALSTLQTSVNGLQTSVTNISNSIPPTLSKVSGYHNAVFTSSSSFNITLDYTGANEYQYKIDNGGWSSWTSLASHDSNGYLTVTGLTSGFHTIYIQIRSNNGSIISPVAKGSITVQKS